MTDEVNDADSNPTNELQTLSLAGNTLSISGGNAVTLNVGNSPWQPFAGGIYYNQGEAWVGTAATGPGLRMANQFLEFRNGAGQTTLNMGEPGLMQTFANGNFTSKIGGNNTSAGFLQLFNPSGSSNFDLNSLQGYPNASIFTQSSNGNVKIQMTAEPTDVGKMSLYGSSNQKLVYLGDVTGSTTIGSLATYNDGYLRTVLTTTTEDAGNLQILGPLGPNASISNVAGYPNTGSLIIYRNGKLINRLSIDPAFAGAMSTFGPNESYNTFISSLSSAYPNNGSMEIFDASNKNKVHLYADEKGTGTIEVKGSSDSTNVRLTSSPIEPNAGKIEVLRNDNPVVEIYSTPLVEGGILEILQDDEAKVTLRVTDDEAGQVSVKGAAGDNIVEIRPPTGEPDVGGIGVYGQNSMLNAKIGIVAGEPNSGSFTAYKNDQLVSFLTSNQGNAGTLSTFDTNGKIKTLLSTSTYNEAGTFTTFYNNKALIQLNTTNGHGGYLLTYLNELPMTHLTHNGAGAGGLWLSNADQYYDVTLASNNNPSNTGGVLQLFKTGLEKVKLDASTNAGILQTKGAAGQLNTYISYQSGDQNGGTVATYHQGSIRTALIGDQGTGVIRTYDSNLLFNVNITSLGSNVNHGYVSVNDFNGIPQAGAYVDAGGQGIIWGDTKNFRIKHPAKSGKEIWYASLEGPEAAAYVRGTATLSDGKAVIEFPEHFGYVANPATMTVMMTPLSPDSKGLCVLEKTATGFTVQELWSGKGNYDFDWEVKCVRKGHENYKVIRDEMDAAPAAVPMPVDAKSIQGADGGLPQGAGGSHVPSREINR